MRKTFLIVALCILVLGGALSIFNATQGVWGMSGAFAVITLLAAGTFFYAAMKPSRQSK